MTSIIIPAFECDSRLIKVLNYYEQLKISQDLLEIVVVIDGYDSDIDFNSFRNLNLKVYKIIDKIDWNQPGAKNLGGFNAEGEYLIFCDIDHTVDMNEFLKYVKKRRLEDLRIYRFKRRIDGDPMIIMGSPPGVLCMTRSTFVDCIGGFDEDFSDHYGYDDKWLIWIVIRMLNGMQEELPVFTSVDMGSGTRGLDRTLTHNKRLFEKKKEKKRLPQHHLRFTYEKIR